MLQVRWDSRLLDLHRSGSPPESKLPRDQIVVSYVKSL